MYNSGFVKAMFCVRFTYVIELFWISVNFVEREREDREKYAFCEICRI